MKKILAALLTVMLVFTMAVPAFASENEAEYNGNPVVIVRGISFTNIRYKDGSSPFEVNTGEIFGILLQSIVTRFALRNEDTLYDAFAEIVNDIFEPISYDKDGNPVNDLVSTQYTKSIAKSKYGYFDDAEGGLVKEAAKRYGAENVYLFTYDWRKSSKQLADELNTLIETAKADSGKDQVDIICASMGGMVTTSYLYYYGYESVDRAVFVSGAHNGTYSVGDSFSGNLHIDTEMARNTIDSMIDGNIFTDIIMNVFDRLGAFDYLTGYLNNWLNTYFERANEEVFRDNLGTIPGLWALCPVDSYDKAYSTVFGGCEDEYAGACAAIKETGVYLKNKDAVLLDAYNNGVELSFIAGYNTPGIPILENGVLNSDSTIETVLASNGATVANYGEVLTAEQITDEAYLSPDRVIDASTALFKDCTWFIKNAEHVATDYGTECNAFVFWLLEYEGQPTITSDAAYPQYLVTDANWSLAPLE
ncbi:MAG: hypothetical protein IKY78_04700 [Clostridia bacterium]|nr:hypothetical protein [Clostridia bacterium]